MKKAHICKTWDETHDIVKQWQSTCPDGGIMRIRENRGRRWIVILDTKPVYVQHGERVFTTPQEDISAKQQRWQAPLNPVHDWKVAEEEIKSLAVLVRTLVETLHKALGKAEEVNKPPEHARATLKEYDPLYQ